MLIALLLATCVTCTVAAKPNTGAADDVIACVGEVGPIIVERKFIGWWDGEAASAVRWDALRGMIGDWPVSRGTCLPVSFPWNVDINTDPFPGTGFWFLVRGKNICNVGTYGNDSNGVERVNGACP